MRGLPEPTRQLICNEEECIAKTPVTFYVHLYGGEVEPVPNVIDLQVTDRELIFNRGQETPVRFPRREVYYACCEEHDEPPAMF